MDFQGFKNHKLIHVQYNIYIHTHTNIYTYKYIYTYIYVCMYVYTDIQTAFYIIYIAYIT